MFVIQILLIPNCKQDVQQQQFPHREGKTDSNLVTLQHQLNT